MDHRYYVTYYVMLISLLSLVNSTKFVERNNRDVQSSSELQSKTFKNNSETSNIRGVSSGELNKPSQENGRWVVMTTRLTKKLRKMNFKKFSLTKNNILGTFSLEKEWRERIVKAVKSNKRTVAWRRKKQTLKSSDGSSLSILSGAAKMNPSTAQARSSTRVNVTCSTIEQYNCQIPTTQQVIVPCWYNRYLKCIGYQTKIVNAICRRTVNRCCEGYRLASSGYCERPVAAKPTVTATCGGFLTAQEGIITSPKYPSFYDDDLTCKWKIQGPAGYKVVLKVLDIGLEDPVGACDLSKWECYNFCEFDDLKITDVAAGSTKTLCGYRTPTTHIVSTGSAMEIVFSSDVSSGGPGFKITYALASEYQLSSYHPECIGGQTWQVCHRRCAASCESIYNKTEVLCVDISRFDEITCVPGCTCPPSSPIWHGGKCVKPEFCPNNIFKCGKPAVKSKLKIVGGRTAGKLSWPWMAQLESDSFFHICGATLICSNWVITAAHCFLNYERTGLDLDTKRYVVNVGKYWKHDQRDGRIVQIFEPQNIIVHPHYKVNVETKVDTHDVTLIRLPRSVEVTDYVRPACLPQPTLPGVTSERSQLAIYQQPKAGISCKVLGWGTTEGIGPKAEQLKEASISIRSGASCIYSSYNWRLMICAGGHKDEDTCKGDSGGPLLCKRGNDEWFIDGITSFGDSCGEEGIAGGYTRISSYVQWIRQNIGYQCER